MRLTIILLLQGCFFLASAQERVPEADSVLAYLKKWHTEEESIILQCLLSPTDFEKSTADSKNTLNELAIALWDICKEDMIKRDMIKKSVPAPVTPELHVFPNPVSEKVHLEGNWQQIQHIYAIDERGSKIEIDLQLLQDKVLSLASLPAGLHILIFDLGSERMTNRIIKK